MRQERTIQFTWAAHVSKARDLIERCARRAPGIAGAAL